MRSASQPPRLPGAEIKFGAPEVRGEWESKKFQMELPEYRIEDADALSEVESLDGCNSKSRRIFCKLAELFFSDEK